jgi:hypothetical protein
LLLPTIPHVFAVEPGVASAAAAAGYSTRVAFNLVFFLLLACTGSFLLAAKYGWIMVPGLEKSLETGERGRFGLLEGLLIFTVPLLLYFPWALARTGPFTEDSFFLSVLQRMWVGQRPYVDFGFMYGPLMLYIPYLWLKVFGYSGLAYYGLVAIIEATKYLLLLLFLQAHFPNVRERLKAFVVLAPFLFNVLLGPNYDGSRQMLAATVLMIVASRPYRPWAVLVAGILEGVLLSYSPEFAMACAAAVAGIYLLLALRLHRIKSLLCLSAVLITGGGAWLAITLALLGRDFHLYLREFVNLSARYEKGEMGFPFYWTVNSLAIFGLMVLACCVAGVGLGSRAIRKISSGDLLFFGAFVYALVSLKSGLNRCDLWHLTTPVFVLALALVLPWPRSFFPFEGIQVIASVLLVIVAYTYVAGLGPSASQVFAGWVSGMREIVGSHQPESMDVASAAPMIRRRVAPRLAVLSRYMSAGETRRPVAFYWRTWSYDKIIGIPNAIHPSFSSLTSDEEGEGVTDFLVRRPDTLMVMDREAYRRVYRLSDPSRPPEASGFYKVTPVKALLSRLSTVHFAVIEGEIMAQEQRWDRTVGSYLRGHYVVVAEFEKLVVLAEWKARRVPQ